MLKQKCCLTGCKNPNGKKDPRISFHSFPKDPVMRQKWVMALQTENFIPGINAKLCSAHFKPEDINFTFASGMKKLRENVIPSVFNIPSETAKNEDTDVVDRTNRTISSCHRNDQSLKLEINLSQIKKEPQESEEEEEDGMDGDVKEKSIENNSNHFDYQINGNITKCEMNYSMDTIYIKNEVFTDDICENSTTQENDNDFTTETGYLKSEIKNGGISENSLTQDNDNCINTREVSSETSENESNKSEMCSGVKGVMQNHNKQEPHDNIEEYNNFGSYKVGGLEYLCNICKKVFTNKENFKKHIASEHKKEKPFSCSECNKAFSHSDNLKIHMQVHTGSKPFECDHCYKEFSSSESLSEHLKSHIVSGDNMRGKNLCKVCKKAFTTSSNLKVHMRSHSGIRSFVCTVCNKSFSRSTTLNAHMKLHMNCKKEFKCNMCEKEFHKLGNLNVHMQYHLGAKPFQCSECNKAFTQSSHLKIHLRSHTGIKPFLCTECNKGFTSSTSLKEHERCHTGVKPYRCKECDKNYSRSGALKAHMRSHAGLKPFVCSVCNKAYAKSSSLAVHLKKHFDSTSKPQLKRTSS